MTETEQVSGKLVEVINPENRFARAMRSMIDKVVEVTRQAGEKVSTWGRMAAFALPLILGACNGSDADVARLGRCVPLYAPNEGTYEPQAFTPDNELRELFPGVDWKTARSYEVCEGVMLHVTDPEAQPNLGAIADYIESVSAFAASSEQARLRWEHGEMSVVDVHPQNPETVHILLEGLNERQSNFESVRSEINETTLDRGKKVYIVVRPREWGPGIPSGESAQRGLKAGLAHALIRVELREGFSGVDLRALTDAVGNAIGASNGTRGGVPDSQDRVVFFESESLSEEWVNRFSQVGIMVTYRGDPTSEPATQVMDPEAAAIGGYANTEIMPGQSVVNAVETIDSGYVGYSALLTRMDGQQMLFSGYGGTGWRAMRVVSQLAAEQPSILPLKAQEFLGVGLFEGSVNLLGSTIEIGNSEDMVIFEDNSINFSIEMFSDGSGMNLWYLNPLTGEWEIIAVTYTNNASIYDNEWELPVPPALPLTPNVKP